ncbi:uncharacterized protein LOC129940970 [Eupeodes corollae]|uniref:uncharacterized protein LOC129940970 n=1 Tax=Eupeodes corollae TaxID=290404 RepID=UPI002492F0CD|nr:uncharacterized protein LOC129940970 [Eupeodes corollae]
MQMKVLFCVLYGILFVKGTPFHPESSIDLLKFNEVQEQFESNSNNGSLLALNSNETLEATRPEENIQGGIFESTITIETIHGHVQGHNHSHEHTEEHHAPSSMGPVESGLRNVVSASALATEELFMEMAALSSETSNTINTKAEILMSHAMNEIFKSLSKAETEIKKNQECGKQFVNSFNTILSQVDSNLKTCVYNLTLIGVFYKNQTTQILADISNVAEEIDSLPDSCEIQENFAVGTFCTVNNLAEINARVVMNVKGMKMLTAVATEKVSKAASSTVICHKHLTEVVLEKLNNLVREVGVKCNQQQTKPFNNEI